MSIWNRRELALVKQFEFLMRVRRAAERVRARSLGSFAALVVGAISCHSGVSAQTTQPPAVITPLNAVTDPNAVNLVDGKVKVEPPTLSIPAAPRLIFQRAGDVAPYMVGHAYGGNDGLNLSSRMENASVHTGGATSESFQCSDYDCTSVTGTGSILGLNGHRFVQAGSGAIYHFDVKYAEVSGTSTNSTRMYYASEVDYADGEVISYIYQSYTDPLDTLGRAYQRPIKISSNTGFHISISYMSDTFGTNAWNEPHIVAIYANADSGDVTPLAKFTYSNDGATITDLANRVYQCTACAIAMGSDEEVAWGSEQLPGEGTNALQYVQQTQVGSYPLVGSAVRDGVNWSYSYNNLTFDSYSTRYWYDDLAVTGPSGYHEVYHFIHPNQRNIIASSTDSIGRTTAYVYDNADRLTQVVYPEGNKIIVAYDGSGNVAQKTTVAKSGSGLPDLVETAYFNPTCTNAMCYRPQWSKDTLNRQTDYYYDSDNIRALLIKKVDPVDASGVRRETHIVYTTTAPYQKAIERICSGSSCQSSDTDQTSCVGQEICTRYQYWGSTSLPSSVTKLDPAHGLSLTTAYSYDGAGRVLSVDGPRPGTDDTTYYRYDAVGRKIWEIGPLAPNGLRLARRFTFRDSDDKVTVVEDGTVTSPSDSNLVVLKRTDTNYDGHRNPTREALSSGGTIYSVADKSWDDRGQLICSTIRMNSAMFGGLPADACTLSTTGSQGPDRVTKNFYDNAGQLLQVHKAVGTTLDQAYATYSYTSNGKQQYVIDANGNRAFYAYDGYDRLARWYFPSATAPSAFNPASQATALSSAGSYNAGDYEEYGYDAAGNRTSLRKRDGTTLTYQFDNLNRLTRKTVPERTGLSSTHTRDVFYDYDLLGHQLYARFDGTSGEGITSTYDGADRLLSSSINLDGAAHPLSYQYDEAGNRTRLNYPDGQYVTYSYDALNRPSSILRSGATTIASYGYDTAGRRNAFNGGFATSYAYDAVDRLSTLANNASATNYNNQYGFSYNPAAQIAQSTRSNDAFAWTGSVNGTTNYTPNGLNQYAAVGGASFCYDANGNLTADGASAYLYDVENRLVERRARESLSSCPSWTSGYTGALQASLRYDPMGRLYELTSGSGAVTRLLYDGDMLLGEYDSAGNLLRRYIHGADMAADDPIAWFEGSGFTDAEERLLRTDWQGSIVAVGNNTSSAIYAVNSYDEYGAPAATNLGRFQYTGQIWLPEVGLYYYKARIYSPTLGRFLQTDPVGYKDQMDLYAYVANDPVNQTDSTGMCPSCIGFAVGVGVEALAQYISTGEVDVSSAGLAKLGVAGLAGAAGAGIGTGIAKISANIAVRAVSNGVAGAAIGAGQAAANSKIDGKSATAGQLAKGAALGAAGAAAGSAAADAVKGSARVLAEKTGVNIGTRSGQVATPNTPAAIRAASAVAGNAGGGAPNVAEAAAKRVACSDPQKCR